MDTAGRARRTQPVAAGTDGRRPVAATGTAGRLCPDLRAGGAAAVALPDLCAGAALWIQPDDAAAVADRCHQVHRHGRGHRPSPGGPVPGAHRPPPPPPAPLWPRPLPPAPYPPSSSHTPPSTPPPP